MPFIFWPTSNRDDQNVSLPLRVSAQQDVKAYTPCKNGLVLAVLTLIVLLTTTNGPATAGPVVYSTLSPTGSYQQSATRNIAGTNFEPPSNLAAPFTPLVTVSLNTIELGLTRLSSDPSAVDTVEVVLMSSNGALPDAVIETLGTFSGFPRFGTTDDFLVTATSTLQPQLTAGTEYWVAVFVADPDTNAGWNFSFFNGLSAGDTGSGWSSFIKQLPAFRVTAIPEPSTLTLAALALVGLITCRRRRA